MGPVVLFVWGWLSVVFNVEQNGGYLMLFGGVSKVLSCNVYFAGSPALVCFLALVC